MPEFKLKDNRTIIVRDLKGEDATEWVQYLQKIAGESDFLTFGTEGFNPKVKEIAEQLEGLQKLENSFYKAAEIDGELVGAISLKIDRRPRLKHSGEFGVSVLKEYWGLGIASKLVSYMIDWAKETGSIRKINLKVRTDNLGAIHIYTKLGFEKEGLLTREFLVKGKFYDCYLMGLKID